MVLFKSLTQYFPLSSENCYLLDPNGERKWDLPFAYCSTKGLKVVLQKYLNLHVTLSYLDEIDLKNHYHRYNRNLIKLQVGR